VSAWGQGFAAILLILGTTAMTVAVIGTFRWRDIHMRNHAAAKSVFFGVLAILAAAPGVGDASMVRRAALIAVVLLLTAPVSSHVIAQAHQERPDEADS
jgi:multicomponent Na+:H+ antiporter subunit G